MQLRPLAGLASAALAVTLTVGPITATASAETEWENTAPQTPGNTQKTPTKIPNRVNLGSINTAKGAAQLQSGFNCPDGKDWSNNGGVPTCVGTGIPAVSGMRPCNSELVTWKGITGAECSATAPVRDHDKTASLTVTGEYTGSATALCKNGSWTTTGATNCTPPPCPAIQLQWSVGDAYCHASASMSTNGQNITLTTTNNNNGSATFMCHNGAWGKPTGVTCSLPYVNDPGNKPVSPPTKINIDPPEVGNYCTYSPYLMEWGTNLNCKGTGTAQTVGVGQTVTVNSTSAYSGAVTFSCVKPAGASFPYLAETGRSCTEPKFCSYAAFGKTAGSTWDWKNSTGSAACSGPLPAAPAAGTSITVTSNNGNNGTYIANCRADGTWDPNAVVTCGTDPKSCAAKEISWTGTNGAQCSALAPETPFGQTATMTSSGGNVGQAKATCNSGTWSAPFANTCDVPRLPCNGGTKLTWDVCYGSGPASVTPDGGKATTANEFVGYSGSASFTCDNGAWIQDSGATCKRDLNNCAGNASLSWGATKACFAYGPAATTANGASFTVQNTTPDYKGSASYTCNDGILALNPGSTCESTPPPPKTCKSESIGWTDDATGNYCSGVAPLTNGGQTVTLAKIADGVNKNYGLAQATCDATTGTWSAPFNKECTAPQQGCASGSTMAWGNCYGSGPTTETPDGGAWTATNVAYGYEGLALHTCKNGAWQLAPGWTCKPSLSCAGAVHSWTNAAGDICKGQSSYGGTNHGQTVMVETSMDAANQGTAEITCNNGTWSAPFNTECIAPPIAPPQAQMACEIRELGVYGDDTYEAIPAEVTQNCGGSGDGYGCGAPIEIKPAVYAWRRNNQSYYEAYGVPLPTYLPTGDANYCYNEFLAASSTSGMSPIAVGQPHSENSWGRVLFCTPESTDEFINNWVRYHPGIFAHRGSTVRLGLLRENGGALWFDNWEGSWHYGSTYINSRSGGTCWNTTPVDQGGV